MLELIAEYKKQTIIFFLVIIAIVVFLLFFVFKKDDIEDDYVNEALEVELSEEDIEKQSLLEIGNDLYQKATDIYSMSPYCGISFKDIDEDDIESINGIKYYKTNYLNISDINTKISQILENNNIVVRDIIMKDGFVYCKYNEPLKTNSYLGSTTLDIETISNKLITFKASSYYLSSTHSEICNLDNKLECTKKDRITENNNFVIVNINGIWKVREFHLYH